MQNLDGQTERNYLIDCLRILAVLMVLTVHVRGYLHNVPTVISKVFGLGAYGVALYFVISGFLAYSSVIKSKNFKDYSRKKAVRILPMYYISLFFTFIVGGVIFKEYPISWEWVYHLFFLNMFVPAKEWMWWNSVNFFWTMPAFIAWYILSYPLLKKADNSKKMAIITLVFSVLTPFIKNIMINFSNAQFVNWNFFCLIYVFCLGVLAYFVIEERKHMKGMLYGLMIGIIGILSGNRSGFFLFGNMFYFGVIIMDLLPIKWLNAKINRIVKNLSAISYATYLTHWFILMICGERFGKLPWLIGYMLFLLVASLFGYICFRYIEKPLQSRLKFTCANIR